MSRRNDRRAFLTGRAAADAVRDGAEALLDRGEPAEPGPPAAGPTVRLTQRAMACEFAVVLNPGRAGAESNAVTHASDALSLVSEVEDRLSVYRPDSEVSRLNRHPAGEPFAASPELFGLLTDCETLRVDTGGAFDAAAGAAVALWRRCRDENRLPTDDELAVAVTPQPRLVFDAAAGTVTRTADAVRVDLGAVGKGDALDRAADLLADAGVGDVLLHGGRSSVLARGTHGGHDGWPVGLGNPHRPTTRLGTILLGGRLPGDRGGETRAMGTSGSNVQFYRHGGRRYGHILDPRTGRPVAGMLSAVVTAPTATEADALSTAFFVLGVERAAAYCDNHPLIGAVLTADPTVDPAAESAVDAPAGGRLSVVVKNLPADRLFLDPSVASAAP